MSQRSDLLDGFAALLAAECASGQHVTWHPDGTPYAADATGVYRKKLPTDPDRAVALTLYDLGDDATYADSTVGLQIMTRGTRGLPADVDDLDEALSAVLVGRWPMTVGGVHVQTLARTSGVSLGQDDNLRWTRTSNFTCGVHLPAAHRL